MSLNDYIKSIHLATIYRDDDFYALVMLLMRLADSDNIIRLKTAFPEVYQELAGYYATGGVLESDKIE